MTLHIAASSSLYVASFYTNGLDGTQSQTDSADVMGVHALNGVETGTTTISQ